MRELINYLYNVFVFDRRRQTEMEEIMKVLLWRIGFIVMAFLMVIFPTDIFFLESIQYVKVVIIAFFLLMIGLFFSFDNKS